MNKLIINILVVFLASTISFAQQVSGIVTEADSGAPLPGATVLVKGTNIGTTTDFDGVFQLSGVSGDVTLVISYIGFDTQEVAVNNATNLTIVLTSASNSLDEMVVIGYGSQRKKEVTGAVSVINSKTIEKLNPIRAEQALQGQVPGVNITSQSGSPGSGFNIRIRGITTNGDNSPLILVDGNRIVDLNAINPNDIASINIIKDATAGIYGVQAANGVILINSKSGGKNTDLTFQLSSYTALQQTSKKLELMKTIDFAQYINDAADRTEFFVYPQQGTDWQDEVFEVAPMSEINLSGYGGGEKSSYSFGVSYLNQDGIVGGSSNNYERITARMNYKYDVLDNLELSANVFYFEGSKQNLPEGGIGSVLYNAVNLNPTMPVYAEDGTFALANDVSQIELINPVAQIANTYNTSRASRLSGILGLEYTLLDNIIVTSKINYNHATVLDDAFRPEQNYGNGKGANVVGINEVIDNGANYSDWMWDNFITYENTFNDIHNLKVLLGTSLYQTEGLFYGNTGRTSTGTNQLGQTVWDEGMIVTPRFNEAALAVGADWFDSRLSSAFARVQYNYDEKYLLSAAVRRDVSSQFSAVNGNNVGFFPSASIGWNVSEENFMQNVDWINQFKIRGSYGIIGNDRIPPFGFVTRLNGEAIVDPGNNAETIDDLLYGAAAGTLGNEILKWEEQETANIGIDLRFFSEKLIFSADAFRKKTKDLLLSPQASALTGVRAPGSGVPFVNAGTVQNQGIEVAVGYYGTSGDDFNYNFNFNFTTIDNEVLSLNGRTTPVGGEYGVGLGITDITRMAPGFALGHYFGYKTNGIYQTQSEIDELDAAAIALHGEDESYSTIGDIAPGDLRFVDIDGDGQITAADRTNIGDPIPDIEMGLNIGFTYKNFDFNAYAFASLGHELVRDYERKDLYANRGTYMLHRWQGSGTSNSIPRAVSGANINTDQFSDFHIEDASFLRLQNVQFGYDFASKLNENLGIKKLRLYISGNNLFTLTDYKGYDPSANTGAALGGGIDKGFYPVATTYLLGINLDF